METRAGTMPLDAQSWLLAFGSLPHISSSWQGLSPADESRARRQWEAPCGPTGTFCDG